MISTLPSLHITVDDFFIASAEPDSADLVCRRNTTLPFAVNVACVDSEGWRTQWTMVDRNLRRHPLGEGDSLDILFDLAGGCAVETEVEWNNQREDFRWNVTVRSAIW